MRTLRRLAVFLFLLSLLATPWEASAAGSRVERLTPVKAEAVLPHILRRAWVAVVELWTKEGCQIDPHGRCTSEPAQANQVDAGCNIDPSGRCNS